jgi:GT2 family glycosyltransferase
MLVKAELFFGVGGFDEEFVVDFNDIDLCLRIGSLGYKILNDPYSVMFHYESATRKESAEVGFHAETALFLRRWSNLLAQGDPYYSPLLSIVRDHEVGRLNEVYHPARVTATRPWLRPVCEGVATRVTTPVYYPSVRTAPNGT